MSDNPGNGEVVKSGRKHYILDPAPCMNPILASQRKLAGCEFGSIERAKAQSDFNNKIELLKLRADINISNNLAAIAEELSAIRMLIEEMDQ